MMTQTNNVIQFQPRSVGGRLRPQVSPESVVTPFGRRRPDLKIMLAPVSILDEDDPDPALTETLSECMSAEDFIALSANLDHFGFAADVRQTQSMPTAFRIDMIRQSAQFYFAGLDEEPKIPAYLLETCRIPGKDELTERLRLKAARVRDTLPDRQAYRIIELDPCTGQMTRM